MLYINMLYVVLTDAKDVVKLTENNVDHIVAIYDNPTHVLKVCLLKFF